jgi:diguanylate cyclase (GGDEF)-like protein
LPKRGLPEERTMVQAVGHAAPVLANLRTLAIAEAHAATDVVTGLPNRRSVDDTLRTMAAQADRAARPLSVVMVDLDRFKAINDRWGHGKGDEVLATIAGVLRRSVRTADFVGRAGGEEFVLLLADTDHTGALVVAEKVRKAVARTRLPMIDRPVTASFGVAVFPRDCSDASELLDYADEAMYEAKQQGRNRVASYDPPVPSPEESLAR